MAKGNDMLSRFPLLGAIIVLALPAGCTSAVPHLDGEAAPVSGSPSSTVAASLSPPPPSVTASSAAPSASTKPTPGRATPSGLVIGPTGLGKLKIGMTVKQAKASGMIASYEASDHCGYSRLRNAPADQGAVTHSNKLGVIAISGYSNMRTPEGIRIGSTLNEVRRAYDDLAPSVVDRTLTTGSGRLWTDTHDGNNVSYRMSVRNFKVTELGLERAHQDCYE